MNVLTARVRLRDRAFIDVLDLALRFVASHAKAYGLTALVVVVPWFAITWWIGDQVGWFVGWLVALAASLFVQAPFTTLASRLVFEERVRVRDALAASVRALPRLAGARLVQSAIVLVGGVFLVLPGLWMGATFLVVPEVVVLERTPVFTSLGRASRITVRQLGDAFLAVFVMVGLVVAAPLLGDYAGRSILEDLFEISAPEPLLSSGGGPLALAGFWALVPVWATIRFFVYINLRTRIEGWDVQTRFAAIAARASEQHQRREEAA